VPTNKQRRQAAQRHLQKQLERRAELARRRRRNLGIVATIVAVAVVVVAALVITGVFSSDSTSSDAASGSSTPAATDTAAPTTNADGTISCNYQPDTSGNPNLKDVGTPPTPEATPTQGTATLLMSTTQGDLTLTLDRSASSLALPVAGVSEAATGLPLLPPPAGDDPGAGVTWRVERDVLGRRTSCADEHGSVLT